MLNDAFIELIPLVFICLFQKVKQREGEFAFFQISAQCFPNKILGANQIKAVIVDLIGCGLEPFLSRKSLDEVLKKSQPLLGNADYSGAILTIIDGVYDLMQKICEDLKDILDRSEMECSHPNEY